MPQRAKDVVALGLPSRDAARKQDAAREQEPPLEDMPPQDRLAPARGIMIGLAVAAAAWGLIAWGFAAVWR